MIEQCSDVPYTSDAMFANSKILQDNESTAWYLVRVKVLLEQIHCMSRLSDISGYGLDHLSLVSGLREPHIWRRVTKEQESWRTM